MIWTLLFWISVILMFHSYVWYPLLLQLLAYGKKLEVTELPEEELPDLVVLMSVYNGERLIRQKVESIFTSAYPAQKVFAYIGSDCSDDGTNQLLTELVKTYPNLKPFFFSNRIGKIRVINQLMLEVKKDGLKDSVCIMTDLSAMFDAACFKHLVNTLQMPGVGLAGAYILKGEHRKDGISFQEKAYYDRELQMKYREGLLWGASAGAFGACYAIRTADMKPVPPNFLVDDFFMTMQLLQQGKKAVYSKKAIVYMELPNESAVEFRRKARIAAGNFQNLRYFLPLLFKFNATAFALCSHKVIRWLGPFFMLTAYLASYQLYELHVVYRLAFITQSLLLASPLVNYLLEQAQIHLKLLKFVAHFYLMNLGILAGFFNYAKGIKTNVWTPTQR